MNSLQLISQGIDRLRFDYDQALALVGGDESLVTLHLPAEWVILARRLCELIVVEVAGRAEASAASALAPAVECRNCALSLWRVTVGADGLRRTECARCGWVCHV